MALKQFLCWLLPSQGPFQLPLTSATPALHLPRPQWASAPKALSITTVQVRSRESRDCRGSKYQEKSTPGPTYVPGCGLRTVQLVLPGGGGGHGAAPSATAAHREWPLVGVHTRRAVPSFPVGRTVSSRGQPTCCSPPPATAP